MIKPILHWAGGKTKLAPDIIKYFPDNIDSYIEPFCGALGMLLYVKQSRSDIKDFYAYDINEKIIALYQTVQNDVNSFIKELKIKRDAFNSSSSMSDFYYQERLSFNKKSNPVSLVFLNKCCFNGLYRENANGEFNVPYGKKDRFEIDEDNIRGFAEVIQGVKFFSGSFQKAFENTKENDLIYCDPPYWPVSKSANFDTYSKDGFGKAGQLKLKELFTNTKSAIIESNSNSDFIKELYSGCVIQEITANRNITCKTIDGKRPKTKELIIIK